MTDVALLIVRCVLGLVFVAHGSQKLFGWFGGRGFQSTSAWLESIGIKPGRDMTLLLGGSEVLAGLLLIAGLLLPVASLLIITTMLVAIATVTGKNGPWVQKGGYEYNVIVIALALMLMVTGPGQFSL